MYQASKPKSAAKIALPRSADINVRVLRTLQKTAEIVGSTLGPFGQPVLLERPEMNLKPIVTKDGVTVFKHLGYEDAVEQVVLEAARDAVVRTAQEAGDGTTTATILSYAIAKYSNEITTSNRKFSPQRVIRAIQTLMPEIEKKIKDYSFVVNADNYTPLLTKVATLSANGDTEIANIIMNCFDLVGEEGNITISEEFGLPSYKVEKFDGYTVDKGYEESCQNFYSAFINDPGNSRTYLEKPTYLLFDGQLNDINSVIFALQSIGAAYEANPDVYPNNIVLVAHNFSKTVLGFLAHNFLHAPVKVMPLKSVQSIQMNSQSQFMHDLAAFVGAKVFNPIANPMSQAPLEDLIQGRSEAFESSRFRSTVIGMPDPSAVELRVDELKTQIAKAESVFDRQSTEIRIAKLTCGIAKVKVIGPSQVEIRERKDRAEDAWCAIRSASKHGALPGGCWTLVQLHQFLLEKTLGNRNEDIAVAAEILSKAFLEPVSVLYTNAGYTMDEIDALVYKMLKDSKYTFNLQEGTWVEKDGILDSAAAVLEAIRNSVSIATLLGTLGGIIVFKRDEQIDRTDSKDMNKFMADLADENNSSAD